VVLGDCRPTMDEMTARSLRRECVLPVSRAPHVHVHYRLGRSRSRSTASCLQTYFLKLSHKRNIKLLAFLGFVNQYIECFQTKHMRYIGA
jgi:hypothetical protein